MTTSWQIKQYPSGKSLFKSYWFLASTSLRHPDTCWPRFRIFWPQKKQLEYYTCMILYYTRLETSPVLYVGIFFHVWPKDSTERSIAEQFGAVKNSLQPIISIQNHYSSTGYHASKNSQCVKIIMYGCR